MKWAIAVVATVVLAVTLARRAQAAQALASEPAWTGLSADVLRWLQPRESADAEVAEQLPDLWETAIVNIDPRNHIAPSTAPSEQAANLRAFLDMIAYAEGTAGQVDDGYRTMFGYRTFDSYADHPRQAVQFTDGAGRKLWTSAAGRYQFMAISPLPSGASTKVDTWDRLRRDLGLPDFSPASQDAAAVELIRQRGALNDVYAGRFDDAVAKVAPVWASLPGAGYSQPERKLTSLRAAYREAGGTFEA